MAIKISARQNQQIKKICREHGIVFMVVFGSAVSGKRSEETDLDIAILTKKETGYKIFKRLFSELSAVFKGENVDLRFLNNADPFFRFEVVKDGKLIYGNRHDYNDFKIYCLKVYVDDGRKYFPYLEKLLNKNQVLLERNVL